MMTPDELRSIVARHKATNEFDVKEDPNPEAHADRGALLDLLRSLVTMDQPRLDRLRAWFEQMGSGSPMGICLGCCATEGHANDCPWPTIMVLAPSPSK